MNKNFLNISLKMIIVGIVTLIIAYLIGITNYTTAAAIGILSVQWTKRDFLGIAFKRMVSGVLSIIVSALLFYYLGTSVAMKFILFSVFMIGFITLSWLFNAPEGIVPSLVIVAHIFLIETITFRFVIEEILLLLIAIVIAFIVNMTYPQFNSNRMKYNLHKIDGIIEDELTFIINKLKDVGSNVRMDSIKELNSILSEAKMIDRDIILQNDHRYITYLYMRNTQLKILLNVSRNTDKIRSDHPYKEDIANFLIKVSNNIGFNDRATPLLAELADLNNYFIEVSLPKTREEFETRAILFQILHELSSFLELKVDFHKKYPHFMEEGVN